MIFLITLLALVLRLYHTTVVPPSLYIDEVAIGYNAYSIIETGKDEWGTAYPVLFRSFDDYKPPLYIYSVALFEKVLGPTELAVRLPAILFGTVTVLALYYLLDELTGKKRLALLASLFLAISPWHLQFTRAGFETSEALFLIVTGVWLFIKATKTNFWWLLPALLLFSLSTMTYHNARLFVPLFLVVSLLLFRKLFLSKWQRLLLILLLVFIFNLPYLPTWVSAEGRARLIGESLLNQPGNLITNLQQNYVANFSLDYLFFHGDQAGRHSVKKIGELYLWQLPFVLAGIYLLIKRRDKSSALLFAWVLLAAIPSAITRVSPHALRGFIMVIPLTIITAVAIPRRWLFVVTPIVLLELALYLHIYYFHYPKAYAADWSDGSPQTVRYLASVQNSYDQIFVSRQLAPMYLLFYLQFSPAQLQGQNHDLSVLGKFSNDDLTTVPTKRDPKRKSLIVAAPWQVGPDVKILREIKMGSGDTVFKIYEF